MKLKKVNYLTEEKFTQLVNGEIEGKTYNPEQEQYLVMEEGGNVIIETSGTMQTSTLPAMTVPKLTKEQVENIYNAFKQGGYVQVKDSYGNYAITEADVAGEEVRFTYFGVHIGYYIEGSNVIAVEIKEELYRHKLYSSYMENTIYVYTTKSTALTTTELYSLKSYVNGLIKSVFLYLTAPHSYWQAIVEYDEDITTMTWWTVDNISVSWQTWMDFETQEIVKV